FSAAAFWLVAAGIVNESKVKLVGVGVNPTRTALVDLLTTAGFHLARSKPRFEAREPVADLHVRPAGDLRPLRIEGVMAAEMIDELPVLAVAATQIAGTSVISGAGELRVKESDRVAAMEAGLNAAELYELEVTAPRDDFELEVRRTTQVARSPHAASFDAARKLYRKFGTDPTRTRPSSEALLRRVKKGEPLPRINSLVDVANA